MSDDRTFCSNKDCKHTECELHQSQIRDIWRNRSVADFDGSLYCLKGESNRGKVE